MSIGSFYSDKAYAVKSTGKNPFGAKAFRGEPVPQEPNDEPASVLLERIRKEREAEEGMKGKQKKSGAVKMRRTKGMALDEGAREETLQSKKQKKLGREEKKVKGVGLGL